MTVATTSRPDIRRRWRLGALVKENLDECVLCRLCIDAAPPGTVAVRRLYDEGTPI